MQNVNNYFVSPENLEFIALYEASGWSQSHAAKRLWKTNATISRYLSGKLVPELTVLELFRFILASERPGALTVHALKESSLAEWERKILFDLRDLRDEDRARVLAMLKAFMSGLPRRGAATDAASSGHCGHNPGNAPAKVVMDAAFSRALCRPASARTPSAPPPPAAPPSGHGKSTAKKR